MQVWSKFEEKDREGVEWEREVAILIFSITYCCPLELAQASSY